MKRQKRDKSQRAFVRGYHAGLVGKSKESCPSSTCEEVRLSWLTGWREGLSDRWEGVSHKHAVSL